MRNTERDARSVFLTGGTGFLGSHLTVALLEKGHRVCLLARSRKQQTAEERVGGLLDWLGLPVDSRRRLRIIEGDITTPGVGVAPGVLRDVLRQTDEIVHCASSTAFSERKRADVEQVNLFVPFKPVCQTDCKGICPGCGANLNRGACPCDQARNEIKFLFEKVKR